MVPTPASLEALGKLRILNEDFGWYIIPLLAIILYIYGVEIKNARETGDWSTIFAGLTVLGLDLINEIWNALVFTFTDYSAFWTTPGASAFVILIGWNIEILFMFSIAGIVFAKFLPKDKDEKLFGRIPNRWFNAALFAAFCVFIEILLNWGDYLIWEYWWWHWYNPVLIFLIGYFHFFVGAFYVYDMDDKKEQIKFVGIIYAIGIVALIVFIPLGWI
ncbi:MAG: conserved membrane protein of unknown function [Promethearchaeota archaeon]|nr:MAG: conserved membrane protein of unknown function [Candidatus Lokiarchaeota archaeon]